MSNAERVQNLLAGASELPPEQRAAYLDTACRGDMVLRAEVESLLKSHDDAGRFLADPTADVPLGTAPASMKSSVTDTIAAPLREGPGTKIGPYKLLQLIGEGGFGSVFMAEQQQPVQRKVALKIIKLGMDTRQVVARFEQERQALAMMDHPNIARVLDAGATETGRPFFVMELVKGDPIVEYCDKNILSIEDRLELFAQVCKAVQHAHTKGIIHRDIKPSNILVSTQDGRAHTKVIDFGIAKATASKLTEKTLFTEHRQLIGTPEYMSPEQAEGSMDIDTRTDVYSLGVLLYELLTGSTPFSAKELRSAAYAEIQRIIREVEPPKPSTRLSANTDTLASVAAKRHTEPKRLGILVRGDLDWIVMKALEKDRTRRYETANGLAMDIQRYLVGEAVVAAPPSTAYRMRKFVHRHRAQVIAASLVLFAVLAGILSTSWGLVQKNRARSLDLQRQLENEQRSAADNARLGRNAEAVTALLNQCEEALRSGDAAKAGIALDAARKRSAEGGAEQDAQRLSRLSADLDLLVELNAIDQFRWTWTNNEFAPMGVVAARMRQALEKFGADPEAVSVESAAAAVNASSVRARIVVALDWQLWARHSEEVRALLRRLDADPFRNEVRDSNLKQDIPKFVELMKRPAVLEQPPEFAAFLGEFNQVDASRKSELLHAAVLRRPTDMSVLMALSRLSFQSPEMPEGARWSQAAIAVDPTNAAAYGNLGVSLKVSGRLDDAIACYHRAIELDPKAAYAYMNLGNALELTGHLEEALANQRKGIELQPNHFENYCCLGQTLSRHGRANEALDAFTKSIDLNPEHADSRYGMGVVLGQQGRWAEAMDACRKAIELDPKYSEAYGNIGVALRNQGRLDEAIPYFEKALELKPKNALVLTNLAGVLGQQGLYDKAMAVCRRAIESEPKYAGAYFNLGKTYALTGSIDAAIANYRKAIEFDPNYAEIHCDLAQALKQQGNYEESLAEFKRGHELGSKRPDWKYPSADWIREAEAEIAKAARLQPKLPALLKGEYQSGDNAERLEFAYFCQNKKLNYAATGLFTAVLAADPKVDENVESNVRYNAACVAVLSAAGQGEDAANLSVDERVRLRKQALDWLRADLIVATRKLESSKTPIDAWSRWFCAYSQTNVDLVSIRDPAALVKLPGDEQEAFTQFWADLAALLKKAQTRSQRTADAEAPPAEIAELEIAALNNQGTMLLSQGTLADAEQVLAEGVAACQRAFAEPHQKTAMLLHHHADALRALGRLDDAAAEARRAADMYRDHPDWAANEAAHAASVLASILTAQGRPNEALAARRQGLAAQRRTLPPGSAELAGQLAAFGLDLLNRGTLSAAREAEPLLRECLEIRLKTIPEDWRTFNTKSLLGASLLAQVKYAEAKPLLLAGYEGMKQREATIPKSGGAELRIPEALERLVRFYEAKGNEPEAAAWRSRLEAARANPSKPNAKEGK